MSRAIANGPYKLNVKAIGRIAAAIEAGANITEACAVIGVNRSTYYEWKYKGEEARELGESNIFTDFLDAVELAEESRVAMWLLTIERSARAGAWQAAAWKLERMYPERFGNRIEHRGSKDAPVQIHNVGFLSDEELARIAAGDTDG